MRNYEFKLAPAYCLYNGIAVVNQEGSHICFMTERPWDNILTSRLEKAFSNYLEYVLRQTDCPVQFKNEPDIVFIPGNRDEIKRYVSRLFIKAEEDTKKEKNAVFENQEKENEAAAVILLDTIICDARKQNATDIHIEKNLIRFRICGKLETVSQISDGKMQELIQRIKFLAGLNVLEKRRSQDGHFVYGKNNPVFIRVSVMGVLGQTETDMQESVVIRLLDPQKLPLSVEKLGFTPEQQVYISELCNEKNGLVIICGSTGAGKSTTAASMLADIEKRNNSTLKIVSLEDPPEYIIRGVTQIKIDEKINNSFSDALRHVFRQDPDVLMIGEIRDENTACIAVRAALTGHLVIATLHTSSAGAVFLRLENLGIPRNLIVSVLKGVIAQELRFYGGRMCLAADVSIPKSNLVQVINQNVCEDELEDYFEHCTNYAQFLGDIVSSLKNRHAPRAAGKKSVRKPVIVPVGKKAKGVKAV